MTTTSSRPTTAETPAGQPLFVVPSTFATVAARTTGAGTAAAVIEEAVFPASRIYHANTSSSKKSKAPSAVAELEADRREMRIVHWLCCIVLILLF